MERNLHIIAKKLSSSFRKMWLNQKICYKRALVVNHNFLVRAHSNFCLYYFVGNKARG